MDRQTFELNDEDFKFLTDACRPVPYLVVGTALPTSPQENANRAWVDLGLRRGFDGTTVEPSMSKGGRFFTAVVRKN